VKNEEKTRKPERYKKYCKNELKKCK